MTQATGVFVRLPLSDEARELLVDAAAFGEPDDSHDKAILSIGTPVTGAGLDPSRDSFEAFYSQMCTKATGCAGVNQDYVRGLRSGDGYGYRTFLNNVWEAWPEFIDFAQAKLAERDAEITRLKANNDQLKRKLTPQFFCSDILEESSMDTRESIVEEAKGYDDDFTAFTVVEMEGYARVHRSWGFYDQKNKCHWFDAETEALKASAALKGPEA